MHDFAGKSRLHAIEEIEVLSVSRTSWCMTCLRPASWQNTSLLATGNSQTLPYEFFGSDDKLQNAMCEKRTRSFHVCTFSALALFFVMKYYVLAFINSAPCA